MIELIDNFDSYILNENNMTNYLKYKINKAPQEKINNKIFNQNKPKENKTRKQIKILEKRF